MVMETNMTFSRALQLLLAGKEVRRPFWNKDARYKMEVDGTLLFIVGTIRNLAEISGKELVACDWEEYVEPKPSEDKRTEFEKWYDKYTDCRLGDVITNKDLQAAFEAGYTYATTPREVPVAKTKLEEGDLVKGSYHWAMYTLLKNIRVRCKDWDSKDTFVIRGGNGVGQLHYTIGGTQYNTPYSPSRYDMLSLNWESINSAFTR